MTSRQVTRGHQHSSSTDPSLSVNRDEIIDFKSLRENLARKLNLDNWFHLTSLQNLHIFNVATKTNGNLSIRNTIHVNIELMVKVYSENDEIVLTVKLYEWPQLQSLIEQLECKVKRECDDAFGLGAIDETTFEESDDVKDDVQGEAVAFEFCVRNDVEPDSVDPQQLMAEVEEISIFKTEPKTNDILQSGKSFLCAECGKTFTRKARLQEHQRLHEKHFCSICNDTYSGKMSRHMKQEHHNDDTRSYECHICRRAYFSFGGLKRHMKSKHVARAKGPSKVVNRTKVKCPICEKEFGSKDSLKSHKYHTHEKRSWKECLICNRSYDNLKRHMQNVHSEEGKQKNQVCHICGASYKQMSGLRKHMETKHAKDEELYCHICNNGKNYRTKWYLKKHFALVHAYVERNGSEYSNAFECHMCNKRLPSASTLRQHIRSEHNGIAETETRTTAMGFQCEICDKKFGCKQSLHGHMNEHPARKVHKNAKRKTCPMCHKQYVAITDLRLHMVKIHGTMLPVTINTN